jgi:HEXXH motif-containing protein
MMLAFAPSGARARRLDHDVRGQLAASLDRIVATLDGALGVDAAALSALTRAVRSHPVRPAVMGLYSALVLALADADDARAAAALAALASPAWRRAAPLRSVTVRDADLGAGMAACYASHLNDDPAQPVAWRILDDAELSDGDRQVTAALALLGQAFPALHDEVLALVNEVLLVGTAAGEDRPSFHGASSFYLWGALLLNLDAHPTRIRLVEGLAHESGHSLLHGLMMGDPLVRNEAGRHYRSPLRADARPMEGIVHATFVLARMHLALATVLRDGALTAAERDEAARRLAGIVEDYAEGLAVVAADADFTDAGSRIFAAAAAYMADAAGVREPLALA